MIYFKDDGTNGEPGTGISTRESEDDFWRELMEVRGRVPMANPQDAQTDAQPGDTADSNEWLDVGGARGGVRVGCAVRSALVEMDGEVERW
ncbi:unnamed protein product [Cylicocyclus nassatus]|uniref:Uncharacterized protein n=1 Tax=Cylicocyclus nassatus TaxID=53992 RepID=A0AA36H0I0_CYLNA|nr:unnamed protein product [Cylicocyclus nassatus]